MGHVWYQVEDSMVRYTVFEFKLVSYGLIMHCESVRWYEWTEWECEIVSLDILRVSDCMIGHSEKVRWHDWKQWECQIEWLDTVRMLALKINYSENFKSENSNQSENVFIKEKTPAQTLWKFELWYSVIVRMLPRILNTFKSLFWYWVTVWNVSSDAKKERECSNWHNPLDVVHWQFLQHL